MTDTASATTTSEAGFERAAIVHVATVGRHPDTVLSFDGLHPPGEAFEALRALGWNVPANPSPPHTAIEWVPNPVTGENHTLRSWHVTKFRLGPAESWPIDEGAVASRTVETLEHHGFRVEKTGHAVTPVAAAAPPEATSPTPQPEGATAPPSTPEVSVPAGNLFLSLTAAGQPTPERAQSWTTSQGRARGNGQWIEVAAVDGMQGLDSSSTWTYPSAAVPEPVAGHRQIRMLLPATGPGDSPVQKLAKLIGTAPTVIPLSPLGDGEVAVLAVVSVPAASAEMLLSNLRLRFSKAVVREG